SDSETSQEDTTITQKENQPNTHQNTQNTRNQMTAPATLENISNNTTDSLEQPPTSTQHKWHIVTHNTRGFNNPLKKALWEKYCTNNK
ncbi:10029_t:CDS:1, partial [Acaulospora morrowiae]